MIPNLKTASNELRFGYRIMKMVTFSVWSPKNLKKRFERIFFFIFYCFF